MRKTCFLLLFIFFALSSFAREAKPVKNVIVMIYDVHDTVCVVITLSRLKYTFKALSRDPGFIPFVVLSIMNLDLNEV